MKGSGHIRGMLVVYKANGTIVYIFLVKHKIDVFCQDRAVHFYNYVTSNIRVRKSSSR